MLETWEVFRETLVPSLVAYAALLISLFLFHLACAPYKLEKEAHEKTRASLDAREQEIAKLSGARPRVIDATLALAVKEMLSARSGELGIVAIHAEHTATEEAMDLAARLSEVVQMAGLSSTPHSELWGGYDPRKRGVFVRYEGDESYAAFAADLAKVLSDGGIAAETWEWKSTGSPAVFFYVARNPRA